METPKSDRLRNHTMRNHTPRLSERKKKLFGTARDDVVCNEDDMLNGIAPLSRNLPKDGKNTPKITKSVESLVGSCRKSPRVISFFESESEEGDAGVEQNPSPSRRSERLSLKKSPIFSKTETEDCILPHKENRPNKTPSRREAQEAKQLQKMFNNSMQITPRNKSNVIESSSEDETNYVNKSSNNKKLIKRRCEIEEPTGLSPSRKITKTTFPIDNVSISTKSFYSAKNKSPFNLANRPSCRNLFGHNLGGVPAAHSKPRQISRRSLGLQSTSINRGVHHKVRKRSSNISLDKKHYGTVDIDQILNNVQNEKLRKLITAKREEQQQIEKIHNILRKASNPIAMARPLSSLSNQDDSNNNNLSQDEIERLKTSEIYNQSDIDFSDIECDGDIEHGSLENVAIAMNEEVIPLITHQADDNLSVKSDDSSACTKKKFFKSGRTNTTPKEVHLTANIKATVTANGKIAIVPEKKTVKKRVKMRNSVEFSDEQATVDAIVRNLDDSAFGEINFPKNMPDCAQNINTNDNNLLFYELDQQLGLMQEEESSNLIDDIVLQDNQDFYEFRKRLPFNTTDPEIIERQHLLLDFLITNNICTEENFNIFIADPDNHKAEAEKIINDLVIVVTDNQNTDFRQRIPYNTTNPEIIEQQHNFLDFLLENNICTEDNFDIFIANYSQRKAEAAAIMSEYGCEINAQCKEHLIEPIKSCNANNLLTIEENAQFVENSKEPRKTYDENNLLPLENMNNQIEKTTNSNTLPEEILQTPLTITTTSNYDTAMTLFTVTSNTVIQEDQNQSEQQQKLFPVFYPGGCQPLPQLYTRRKQQQRSWNAGYGLNQYQIDAGQKSFGAQQCKQCGLFYTVHEPEEEKLHRDFHASLHILRFKSWIDEDIVAIYPEWGPDGRILRLTESSPLKRRERLLEILKIVDKELGFSSYIVPKTFVAYFAVRKMQIVGLCLVQPLSKANKYVCINGLDCCTEEQFEAKCGVSRIWVSPLHRRLHIGSKLIQAVQLNTIFGEEIPLDKIAFSAPTELGKVFAQKIVKTEHFLVYQ